MRTNATDSAFQCGTNTFEKCKTNDTNMQVYANAKGWWDRHLTMLFFKFQFGNRPNLLEPILLLLDDFSCRWTDELVEYAKSIKVTLLKIPPHATSVCQPADATWNGPLKVRLRNTCIESLLEQLRVRNPEVAFKLKALDRTELCKWIFSTWSAVATSTIAAGFRKYGLIERGCGENEETEAETAPVQENADDIVHEMLEAGALDMQVGEFSLDDDFDDMFRSVADMNLQQ
ncbi:unnamed protein product [Phytophthora lilii]|uniref:Unnamed protein product n=1 Tax=Phytophthora lilii TaxID=2077276 RepID=A0A9W6TH75_9STRA|nr:unnamed protein product [Phytophthora lilii]